MSSAFPHQAEYHAAFAGPTPPQRPDDPENAVKITRQIHHWDHSLSPRGLGKVENQSLQGTTAILAAPLSSTPPLWLENQGGYERSGLAMVSVPASGGIDLRKLDSAVHPRVIVLDKRCHADERHCNDRFRCLRWTQVSGPQECVRKVRVGSAAYRHTKPRTPSQKALGEVASMTALSSICRLELV